MQHDTDLLVPIQADALNATERADTELARQVAKHLGWQIQPHNGTIHDAAGDKISENIEALAAAGRHLTWFNPQGPGILWGNISSNPDTEAQNVRTTLNTV